MTLIPNNKFARVSNKNYPELKNSIKDKLTECDVKLSSKKFKKDLIQFFQDRGIEEVYDIKINKTTITIYFAIDELIGTSCLVGKEAFE